MNIDDLTIGQAKELVSLFSKTQGVLKENKSDLLTNIIGKYVICRSRNEGINCGKVIEADNTGVILKDARRIYYHKPKDRSLSWYEGVAASGLSKDSKISGTVDKKYIIEDYSLTICSELAEKNLRNYEANSQN